MASLVEPEIKEAPQEQVMVIWLYFGCMFAFMGGILSQIDRMCILLCMYTLLKLEGLILPRDAKIASKLQASKYHLDHLPDPILWDRVAHSRILKKYEREIHNILAEIGWIEGALISVASVQQFSNGRAKWSLEGVEKRVDYLPLYTLVFPLDANCLKDKVINVPRSF